MRVSKARRIGGFSLLEVILATAIVASSSMVLLRLISTGEQHQSRAERKAIGQMICQTLVDRMTIDPSIISDVEDQRVDDYPEWTYTTNVESTDFPGLVRIRIQVAQSPIDKTRTEGDRKFDFELVRWIRVDQEQQDGAQPWEGQR